MGLLDNVIGSLGGQGQGPGGQPGLQAQLIQALLQMLMAPRGDAGGAGAGFGPSAGAAGGLGGLGGLIAMLQQAGLGDAAASWVSPGENHSVSPDQVRAAFGDERMDELASRLGLGTPQVASELSEVLPQVVDRMTPDGRLPDDGGLPDLGSLGDLLGGLLGRR
jgi:uncharacterized protein YidB (DUF937 family)